MILLIFAGNHEQYRQWYDQNSRWRDSARYVGQEADIHGYNVDDIHLVRVGTWFENERIQSLLNRAVAYYGPRFMELPLAPTHRPPAEIHTEGEPFDTSTTFTTIRDGADVDPIGHWQRSYDSLRRDRRLTSEEQDLLAIPPLRPHLDAQGDEPVWYGVDTVDAVVESIVTQQFEGPIESFRSAALRYNASLGPEVAPPLLSRVRGRMLASIEEEKPKIDCRCHCHHKVKCKCIKKCKHCENIVS